MNFSYDNFKRAYLTGYRSVGFVVLASTLVALLFYAIAMVFFIFNTTWLAPTILSNTSDRMLQFRARHQSAVQIKQQAEITLDHSIRTAQVLEGHLGTVNDLLNRTQYAISSETQKDTAVINKARQLASSKLSDIKTSQELKSKFIQSRKLIQDSLDAGLITKEDANKQIVGIQNFENTITSNEIQLMQIKEQADDLDRKRSTLLGNAKSLDSMVTIKAIADLKYQALQTENELQTSIKTAHAAKQQLDIAKAAVENLMQSVYLAALDKSLNLAFVPYDNIKIAKIGQPVFNCHLLIIWCYRVGTIKHIYTDEQIVDFPVFNIRLSRTVRGFMVDLNVTDESAMRSVILYANKPLLL